MSGPESGLDEGREDEDPGLLAEDGVVLLVGVREGRTGVEGVGPTNAGNDGIRLC